MKEYNLLVEQYQNLTDEEKNACLIYKSRLSYLINEIAMVDDFLNKDSNIIYEEIKDKIKFQKTFIDFKEIIERPENLFLKMSVMNNVNFKDIYTIIESMKKIYETISNVSKKVSLKDDMILNRLVSSNEDIKGISKSNFISTTINADILDDFMFGKNNILYKIKANKGINAMVIPYSIVISMDQTKLKLQENDHQKEILLFKENLDIEEVNSRKIDNNLMIKEIEIKNKTLNKSR